MLLGMTADEGNALVPCLEMAAREDSVVASAAKLTSHFKETLQQTLE